MAEMIGLWVLLAFVIGGCVGFCVFALMRISRESERGSRSGFYGVRLDGDTLSHF